MIRWYQWVPGLLAAIAFSVVQGGDRTFALGMGLGVLASALAVGVLQALGYGAKEGTT